MEKRKDDKMSALKPAEFLYEIVKVYTPSGSESAVADLIVSQVEEEKGVECEVDEAGDVVVIINPDYKGSRELLLFSHMDTVHGEREAEKGKETISGRGAVDAKGPLASLLFASLCFTGKKLPFRLVFAGVVEEEISSSKGAWQLLKSRKPTLAINGEPSNTNCVVIGYKGRILVSGTARTEGGHASNPNQNSINQVVNFYNAMVAEFPVVKNSFEAVTASITKLTSDSQSPNANSAVSEFVFDVRLPPSVKCAKASVAISALAKKFAGIEIKLEERIDACETDLNSPVVRAYTQAMRENGLEPKYVRKSGSSDMNLFCQAGIPTVAYGPGDSALDHTDKEKILIKDLFKSIEVTKAVIRNLAESNKW
ncbi:[LysW]-lysine/[LysW]-ornithine hydrolase [Candidatus Gugararchaeum adminiculabundum]|nr:[LysW]-lysine/[LysW]-ornithine hydrolase [Candidatus Gugararchaeum adminiculabundum]